MRIALTGASGFVGRQLVPRLMARGADLLLIGRDPDALKSAFPACETTDYRHFPSLIEDFAMVLHLAVVNNDQTAEWPEIERANVDLPVFACEMARDAGVGIFAFVSSTLALDGGDDSHYAASKRLAEERLARIDGIAKTILYFPAVSGDRFAGKLGVLNRLPKGLQRIALTALSALKPTVHTDRIADTIVALAKTEPSTAPSSLIVANPQNDNAVYRVGKRVLDLAFAVGVLVVLWWVMLIVWALVSLHSPGPGLFRQRRVGKGEREFTCYKFRTMLVSTPDVGTHDAPVASVTSLGKLLRRTKLDELPQVFNILANQMSLVGPRPCLPSQTALIEARRRRGVLEILPGITGLAQIGGIDMSDPERLAARDENYLKLQSLLLDVKIVFATIMGKGSGDPIDRPR